jgi:SAM-dependent methyltransferase
VIFPVVPAPPSAWVARWSHLISPGGRVLDLAAGSGRHSAYFSSLGHEVEAVDRDIALLRDIPGINVREADLEAGPWPYTGRRFAGIVVTNYLHRPLFPCLIEALAPGGVLLYETFMVGNERYGRPSNPEFLLKPNELLAAVDALQVLGFEQGFVSDPKPAMVQRICAQRS